MMAVCIMDGKMLIRLYVCTLHIIWTARLDLIYSVIFMLYTWIYLYGYTRLQIILKLSTAAPVLGSSSLLSSVQDSSHFPFCTICPCSFMSYILYFLAENTNIPLGTNRVES